MNQDHSAPSHLPPQQATPLASPSVPPSVPALFLWFFVGMLFFSLYLLYIIFNPFLHSIIVACIFTALCYPFYLRCLRLTNQRPMLASLMVLTCLTFLVALPITFFVVGLIPQAGKSIAAINSWFADSQSGAMLDTYLQPVLLWVHELLPDLDLASLDIHNSIMQLSKEAGQQLLGAGTYLLSNTVRIIFHFMLVLLIMFFLLMDGAALVKKLTYYYPLKPSQTAILIESSRRMSKAVLVGGFAVAALQGILGGIGFAIVGFPAFFWGTVMIFAALVPVVGTGLVWVPALLVLYLQGEIGYTIFLAIWCGVGVTSVDSFLRPVLVRGGANVPLLFIFLSILGGINVFGMLGLLYGPLILGFVATMLDIYGEEYHSILQSRNLPAEPAFTDPADCISSPQEATLQKTASNQKASTPDLS